jgi:hypothetical protein
MNGHSFPEYNKEQPSKSKLSGKFQAGDRGGTRPLAFFNLLLVECFETTKQPRGS